MNGDLADAWRHIEKWCEARNALLVRTNDHHEYHLQNDTIRMFPRVIPSIGTVKANTVEFVVQIRQESQPIQRSEEFARNTEGKMPETWTAKRTIEFTTKTWESCEAVLVMVMRNGRWSTYVYPE